MSYQIEIRTSMVGIFKKKKHREAVVRTIESNAVSSIINREARRIAWKTGRMRINFIIYVKSVLIASARKNPFKFGASLSDEVISAIPNARHMQHHTLGHKRYNKYYGNTYMKPSTSGTVPFSRHKFIRLVSRAINRELTKRNLK